MYREMLDGTDLKEEHAEDVLSGCPDTPEKHRRVNRCEQGAVQPPTTLRDELRHLLMEDMLDIIATDSNTISSR